MKRKSVWFICLTAILCSCSSTSFIKKSASSSTYEDQVCDLGILGGEPQYKVNYMPTGFWGNYPDTGMVEIGGKAGDPYGNTLPDMSFSMLNEKLPTNFLIGICFQNNPMTFEENTMNSMLGMEFTYVDKDGTVKTKNTYRKATCLKDNFLPSDNYAVGTRDSNLIATVETIFYQSKSIVISFNLERGQKLRSIKYTYGDSPEEITNVALVRAQADEDNLVTLPYLGKTCVPNEYTIKVGNSPEYHLKSQYGSVYSLDYLKNAFLAKDKYDQTEIHPDIIEDPEEYFEKGKTATIGSEFKVRLGAKDKQENRSFITFYFTVVDTRAPLIYFAKGKEITSSYQQDFQSSAFLEKYFLITDNYDQDLSTHIYLETGEELPKNKIGTFPCIIESKDQSNNISKEKFTLTLIDDIPPQITSTVDEVNLTPFSNYSKEKLLSLFTAVDDIDGKTNLSIVEDTYSENKNKIGEYVFCVKSSDQSGNTATKSIKVRVQDNEGPVFYAKKSFITASKENIPTVESIISSLIRQEVIPDKNYVKWDIVQGENIDSNLAIGLHEFSLLLETDDKETERVDITMNVIEEKEFVKGTEKTLWDKIKEFFLNLWQKIVSFFRK